MDMGIDQDIEAIRQALFAGQKSHKKARAQVAFLRLAELIRSVRVLDAWSEKLATPLGDGRRIVQSALILEPGQSIDDARAAAAMLIEPGKV